MMKKSHLTVFLAVAAFMLFAGSAVAQCDSDEFLDRCAPSLGTYNYIKSFSLTAGSKKKSSGEFSYVFSKGSTYLLVLCEDELKEGKLVVSLYDRNHNLIASTFNETTGKYYPNLVYPCLSTGVYYIKASFKDARKGCGMCILGFNKA
jgi:hypothetical protein